MEKEKENSLDEAASINESENISESENVIDEVVRVEGGVRESAEQTEPVAAEVTEDEVCPPAAENPAEPAAYSEPEQKKEKKGGYSTVILALAVVVLLAACVVLAIKLIGAAQENKPTPDTPQTTVTQSENTSVTGEEPENTFDVAAFLAPTEGIIATVNGVEVDGLCYDLYKAENVSTFAAYGIAMSEDMAAYIEQMSFYNAVQNEIMAQMAEQEQISVTMDEAQEMMNEIIAEYFSDKDDFDAWLAEEGISEEQYLLNCYYNLLGNSIYMKYADSVEITEAEVKALYDEDPSMYDTRRTSHILIKFETDASGEVSDEQKMAAYNGALAVLTKLQADPTQFAELAKEYSDDGSASSGGVIDYAFTKYDTALVSEYVDATWALEKVGDYSAEPVESQFGYHIIRLDEETAGYENFADAIRDELYAERAEALFDEKFNAFVESSELTQQFDFQYAERVEF